MEKKAKNMLEKERPDGGWTCKCPFGDEHDNGDPYGAFVVDGDGENGFTFSCSHATCAERDRLDHLDKMIELGSFSIDELSDTEYGGGPTDPVKAAQSCDSDTPARVIEQILKAAILHHDMTTTLDVKRVLKKAKWQIGMLNHIEKSIHKKMDQDRTKEEEGEFGDLTDKLTSRYKYIQNSNGFFDRKQGILLPTKNVYNGVMDQLPTDGKGKKVPGSDFLLCNPKSKYDKLVYRPESCDLTIEEEELRCLNTYRSSSLKPMVGDASPILDLIDHLFDGEDIVKEVVLDALAHLVQNPGEKIEFALLISSDHGTGKGTLFNRIMKPIIGAQNYVSPTTSELENGLVFAENRLMAVVNEAMAGDNRKIGNKLKELITEQFIRIRRLYLDEYEIENKIFLVLLSNYDVPAYLEEGDRRWLVHRVTSAKKSKAYFAKLYNWIENENGPAIFMRYLLDRDVSKFNSHMEPPLTNAKRALIESSMGEAMNYLQELYDGGDAPFDKEVVSINAVCDTIKNEHPHLRFNRGHVIRLLRKKGGCELALEAVGYRQNQKRGRRRLWVLKDIERWRKATAEELGMELERFV